MKNSVWIFLLLFSVACKQPKIEKQYSYAHTLVDTLSFGHTKNILVYTINPNDCLSCLNGFRFFDEELRKKAAGSIYIIRINREIERKELETQITCPDLHPQPNKKIIWGKDAFDSINAFGGNNLPLSMLSVYNFKKDSLLFSKPVREIQDITEITKLLEKK